MLRLLNDIYHLLSLSQCQCYCDDKADTPTPGFPLHTQYHVKALKHIHFCPVRPINNHFSFDLSVFLLDYYPTLLNITHNSK